MDRYKKEDISMDDNEAKSSKNIHLSTTQVAELFQVSNRRIKKWVAGGLIKPVPQERGKAGSYKFDLSEVLKLLNGGVTQEEFLSKGLLSVKKAEMIVFFHGNTLRKWAEQGKIKVVRLPEGDRRFPKILLEKLAEELRGANN